jgi:hypothetical protein
VFLFFRAIQDSEPVPFLHVYGPASTGKSLVLAAVLRVLALPNAMLDCVECTSSKILFQRTLRTLCDREEFLKCEGKEQFAHYLEVLAEEKMVEDPDWGCVLVSPCRNGVSFLVGFRSSPPNPRLSSMIRSWMAPTVCAKAILI